MKRTTFKIACATLLSAAVLAWGDDPEPGDGADPVRLSNDGVLSEHLAMYDADGSGGLSVEEYQLLKADRLTQVRHRRLRSKWDLNQDGKVDARERHAAVLQNRQTIELRRTRRFNEVDANTDGFLTEQEFLQINAVNATDLNNPGIGVELFKHLDHNSDLRVSLPEFLRTLNNLRPVDPVDPAPEPAVTPKPRGRYNPLKDDAPNQPVNP